MAYVQSPPITTRADFAKAVLQEIGIVPSGSDPSAEDSADVLARYDREWGQLNRRGIVSFPVDVFPAEVVQPLVRYMGIVCMPLFGLPTNMQALDDAEQALTAVAGKTYSTLTAWNLYF